jgi:hypothetical protein
MVLTVATAVYDDLYGTQMLMQDLLMHHDLTDVELLIVDNHPTTKGEPGHPSDETKKLISYASGIGARYIPMAEPIGTAPPRNRCVAEATGEVVVVCDCHIMFATGALAAIRDYFADPVHQLDIASGPMLAKRRQPDGRLQVLATHYADVWRKEMWGIWGQAWTCPCGRYSFDVAEFEDKPDAQCRYYGLHLGRPESTACPQCGREFPRIVRAKHDVVLQEAGYIRRGWSAVDTEPFVIGGMGLGCFAVHKAHWTGFPPEMRGFGGGELHLHETFRRQGGRAICLPQAGWWHQFERSGGKVPYHVGLWDKVRNYVIWRNHLSWPLDPVHQHFVTDTKRVTEAQWDYLLADPIGHAKWPGDIPARSLVRVEAGGVDVAARSAPAVQSRWGLPPNGSAATIQSVYDWVLTTKRDPVDHLPKIRELAERSQTVVSLVKRREWDVAILAGLAGGTDRLRYVSHNLETDPLQDLLQRLIPYELDHADSLTVEPIDCDILLIDTEHTAARLRQELARWGPRVNRWIVLRGTSTFGEAGESSEKQKPPGLLVAVRELLAKDQRWKRVYQNDARYGLTVLSCDPNERTIDRGPGRELHRIFDQLGVKMQENCACRARIKQMDAWGAAGCRQHLDDIVAALAKDRDKYSWGTQFKAALSTLTSASLFWSVLKSPTDPLRGLVVEAINRTEKEDAEWAASHPN